MEKACGTHIFNHLMGYWLEYTNILTVKNPTTQFTMKVEKEGTLTFLDVTVKNKSALRKFIIPMNINKLFRSFIADCSNFIWGGWGTKSHCLLPC